MTAEKEAVLNANNNNNDSFPLWVKGEAKQVRCRESADCVCAPVCARAFVCVASAPSPALESVRLFFSRGLLQRAASLLHVRAFRVLMGLSSKLQEDHVREVENSSHS